MSTSADAIIMAEDYQFPEDRPKRNWLKGEFSIGTLISLVTILVAISIAYQKLESNSANDHGQILELKTSVSALNSTLVETNLAVRELRVTVQIEGARTRSENRQEK